MSIPGRDVAVVSQSLAAHLSLARDGRHEKSKTYKRPYEKEKILLLIVFISEINSIFFFIGVMRRAERDTGEYVESNRNGNGRVLNLFKMRSYLFYFVWSSSTVWVYGLLAEVRVFYIRFVSDFFGEPVRRVASAACLCLICIQMCVSLSAPKATLMDESRC